MSGLPDPEDLVAFSDMALELARLAGTEMQAALGQDIAIRYKQGDERVPSLKDPVSEVDQAITDVKAAYQDALKAPNRLLTPAVPSVCLPAPAAS